MPEHIRALVVVLILGGVVFLFARPAMVQVVQVETFKQWRRLWFITTLAWFLTPNFWIYALVMVVMLIRARKTEKYIFGLFMLLLLAAPPTEMAIPGFGLVDHLFVLNHYRLLALVLLLPTAMRLARNADVAKWGASPVDWAVLAYLLWISLLGFRETSLTNGVRITFLNVIDYFLPYYVASRSLREYQCFRAVFAAVVLGAAIVSVTAIAEVLLGWRLYLAAAHELGFSNFPLSYKMRGPFLRPAATVIDSIMVGWVIVMSMGGLLIVAAGRDTNYYIRGAWLLVIFGVIASMSRAPWVASIVLMVIFVLQSDAPLTSILKIAFVLSVALVAASLSPFGKSIMALLPFVGSAEQGSVDYRIDWFSVALPVIERNFLFGDIRVLDAPELQVMRQGEGIIDLVNSYLGILLFSGFIGLLLYLSSFVFALLFVQRGKRWCDHDSNTLGRTLIAILLVNAFMLMTVSSILIAPLLIYSSLGWCSAYGLMCFHKNKKNFRMQFAKP